jgi:sugar phosphate isomerase/epimerase
MGIKISSAPVPFLNPVDRFVSEGYKDLPNLPFAELLPKMMEVEGLDAVTVNYPGDFHDAVQLKGLLARYGAQVSPIDTGIYWGRKWVLGSFANNDPRIRREAIEVTKGAMDAAAELGVNEIIIWPGQDGFEYPFQYDHDLAWGYCVDGIGECAEHRPDVRIGIEYKAMEPRARCFIDTAATTLLLCEKIGLPNVGVTLDLGHSINAQESPAQAVALCARYNRLFQVHVNDNYGNWDNDLLVGQVNFWLSLEFHYWLHRVGYDGYHDMDFFPFREDGKAALEQCIRSTRWLARLAASLPDEAIRQLQRKGDPVTISRMLWEAVIKP